MNDNPTLFEVGDACFRAVIHLKLGGGPFDRPGYAVELRSPTDELLALLVHTEPTDELVTTQAKHLVHKATEEVLRAFDASEAPKPRARSKK